MKTFAGYSLLIVVIALITCPSSALAREWAIIGPRALGMGGANVAVANDITASYWNPAAFGFFTGEDEEGGDYAKRDWSADVSVGVGASIHEGFGELMDEIARYDFGVLGGQIETQDVDDYIQLLSALKQFDENENRAIKISADMQFGIQAGRLGIGGIAMVEMSAKAKIDTENIAPDTVVTNIIDELAEPTNFSTAYDGDADYFDDTTYADLIAIIKTLPGWDSGTDAEYFVDAVDNALATLPPETIPADIATDILNVAQLASAAETGESFEENKSKLLFKGIGVFEFPITYGFAINENLAIGGNVKFMKARTYNIDIGIFDTDFGAALGDAQDEYMDSTNFGVDLGMLYRIGDGIRIGLVGRNLNSPKFDIMPGNGWDDDFIEEKPQLRAGICLKPVGFVMLAADCDLTKNDTTISGSYKSQIFSMGVELNFFEFLRLRAGAYKNLAEDDIGLVYTAGVGLNFWLLNVDAGVSMASEFEALDETNIPREVRAEMAVSMLF